MSFTKKVVAGQDISSADFRQYFGDHFSSFVKTGFEVTDDTGLDVSVSAGTAYVKDATSGMYQVVSDAAESMTMENNTTNYIFLHSDNGATYLTSSTTATVPDDAILLATVVTASGDVSSVTDERDITPRPLTEQTYIELGTIVTGSGGSSTYTDTTYINHFLDRYITFRKIKYTCSNLVSGDHIKVYYSINGSDDVQIRDVTATTGATYTDTINVGTSSVSANAYIKFVITTTTIGNVVRTVSNLYISYVMSD